MGPEPSESSSCQMKRTPACTKQLGVAEGSRPARPDPELAGLGLG